MRTVRNILITQVNEFMAKSIVINGDEDFTIEEMMTIVACLNHRIHKHSMNLNYTINELDNSKSFIKR